MQKNNSTKSIALTTRANKRTFTPGSFIRLSNGTLRPLTPEEEARPDIDWPYCVEFPYNRYNRTCIHCKGRLWFRDLGHSITYDQSRLHCHGFGVIVCDNGCKDPVKFTERELRYFEKCKNNAQHIYYTPEEIKQWKLSLTRYRKERTSHVN